MGIKTVSKDIREKLLQRNMYRADSIYNLNKDVVSRTLNKAQALGFDLRSNLALNVLERVVDDTPLVRDGARRLAVEFTRRIADNVVADKLPSVSIFNPFSKSSKVTLTKRADHHITPHEKPKNVLGFIKEYGGIAPKREPFKAPSGKQDRNLQPGGYGFYENLGSGQQEALKSNQALNFFNRYTVTKDLNSASRSTGHGYTIHNSLYSPKFFSGTRKGSQFDSYKATNGNNPIDGTEKEATTIEDTIATNKGKITLKDEGFGSISTGLQESQYTSDESRFLLYVNDKSANDKSRKSNITIGKSDALVGDSNERGITRGLLYHTGLVANTDKGKNIAQHTYNYGDGEMVKVLYKGSSECRSWTIDKRYGDPSTFIRSEGNKNPYSVNQESVSPRIYPKSAKDLRSLMFSIENLAFSKEDMEELPVAQRGPNNGRIMWFPPYGLTVTDNVQVNWQDTAFLGRIEPVVTYSGAKRTSSLSFMILIDTPPGMEKMSTSEVASWFAGGCGEEKEPVKEKTEPVPKTEKKPIVEPPQEYKGPKAKYHFRNNSYTIEHPSGNVMTVNGYESAVNPADPQSLFGLNMAFSGSLDVLTTWVKAMVDDKKTVTIDAVGSCSSLWNNSYNAKLSYKRADAIMKHILAYYNAKYGTGIVIKNVKPSSFYEGVSVDSIKNKVRYEYNTSNEFIKFSVYGIGEEYKGDVGERENEIFKKDVKKIRNASVGTVVSKNMIVPAIPKITPQEAQANQDAAKKAVLKKNNPEMDKFQTFFSGDVSSSYTAKGFDKLKYYKPVFHSQTPHDFQQRYTFLHQCTRPRRTLATTFNGGSNSLFGKMPICVLRIGDFFHTKVAINNLSVDMSEAPWDFNPEGVGVQPMLAKITMDLTLLGSQALEFPVNKLLTANDQNFIANSTYYEPTYAPQQRWDYKQSVRQSEGKDINKDGVSVYDPVYQEKIKKMQK